jgi:hypothetical protein
VKYVTLTDVPRKPLNMRLQAVHHSHLFIDIHSYLPAPGRSLARQLDLSKLGSLVFG